MAQWVKDVLHKHEGSSLDPKNSQEKPGVHAPGIFELTVVLCLELGLKKLSFYKLVCMLAPFFPR